MQKTKKKYEAPALTTVTFKTERGYAARGGDAAKALALDILFISSGYGDQSIEDRTYGTDW